RTLRFTSGRFRQRNVPRHAWRGGAGKRSGASARRPFSFIGQARYGNYGQTAIMVEFTDTIINMPETDRD
uniref:hypothetical protein n=1 Tax=Bifidobacterium adolescentis TaxID=1680 RepID=UPI00359C2471